MNNRSHCIIKNIKGPNVLDVGAASAHADPEANKFWLHGNIVKAFPSTVGIDLDSDNVNKLRELGWDNIHVGNAETYETEILFNTIVAGELIEHVTSPANFLKNMSGKLAPEGLMIVKTPNPFAIFNVVYALRHYPRTCSHWEHTVWFCPTTLTQLAARVGYKVVSIELVQDYRQGSTPIYRAGMVCLKMIGWLLPKVLKCNSFVCVMEKEASKK